MCNSCLMINKERVKLLLFLKKKIYIYLKETLAYLPVLKTECTRRWFGIPTTVVNRTKMHGTINYIYLAEGIVGSQMAHVMYHSKDNIYSSTCSCSSVALLNFSHVTASKFRPMSQYCYLLNSKVAENQILEQKFLL
jgi:hypothetical protein